MEQGVSEYQALLDRLTRFVTKERQTQYATLEAQWAQPLALRLGNGKAIHGLLFDQQLGPKTARMKCTENNSRFREGDFLILHQGTPKDEAAIVVSIDRDRDTEIDIEFENPGDLERLVHGRASWIADEGWLDLTKIYLDALDLVADTFIGRERILPLLAHKRASELDYARYEYAGARIGETELNDSQREAIACSYAATLSHLIQGPPGTGKTLVLAHLAQMFVEDGQRVLITGFTHRAINNALSKTYKLDPLLPICKVGQKKNAREVEFDTAESFAQTGFARLSKGYIIGATPFATRTNRLKGVEFDVVIFDEASQVTLPLAIMGMLAGKKYVFIGDDKQLPPVVVSKGNQVGKHSVFSYLSERGNDTMLTTTYRLPQALAEWPSHVFYNSLLVPHESVRNQKLPEISTSDPDLAYILDPERHKVFVNVDQQNTTTHSRLEADTVCRLVIELLANGIPPSEIGIIAPYRAQGREIRRRLMAELPPEISMHIVADTVERMQGQERDVILVSLTTSSRPFAENLAEFFFQPERLNVTITRARKKVILVGSLAVLAATPNDPEHAEWVDLMRDFVQSCAQITCGV